MAYGLTDTGFIKKDFNTLREELQQEYINRFGTSINVLPESAFGQIVDIMAFMSSEKWDVLEAINNSLGITASGDSLDKNAILVGKRRKAATFSKIIDFELTFTGAATVVAGTTFSSSLDETIVFATDEDVVATGAGTLTVNLTSTTAGYITANIDTITIIDSPLGGLSSVTNPNAALPGNNQETDSELRLRIFRDPTITNSNTELGIAKAVKDLNNVQNSVQIENVFVIDNDELTTDGDGRPGKSVEVIVYQAGGTTTRDSEIIAAIAASKPDGLKTVSTTGSSYNEIYTFPNENTRDITFSRPTQVDLDIVVTLTTNSSFPSAGIDEVTENIYNYINNLTVGQDVIINGYNSLTNAMTQTSGIIDFTIAISKKPTAPTLDDNISIGNTEIAKIAILDIDVTEV